MPSRGSAFSAGADIHAAYDVVVPANGRVLVSSDLQIAAPEGTYVRIASRSGLALHHSIDVGGKLIYVANHMTLITFSSWCDFLSMLFNNITRDKSSGIFSS